MTSLRVEVSFLVPSPEIEPRRSRGRQLGGAQKDLLTMACHASKTVFLFKKLITFVIFVQHYGE
jgi:hypothetical protein